MLQDIIGRRREIDLIEGCINSNKPEFIAIYGRRRIGKTYLVKQLLGDSFCFYMTGVYQCSKTEMLAYFSEQLALYAGKKQAKPKTWFEAFSQLRAYLMAQLEERDRLIIFIDELPWLDTPKSNFIRALDLFWNGWASDQPKIKLIVCGSATTWMTDKLLGDKGGLHNRVTRKIYLAPFDLHETELFLQSKGVVWTRHQIAECYMIMGGTPYYLNMIDKEYSLPQNIDALFFAEGAELASEYEFLFRSLFKDSILYRRIVELLAKKKKGMTREEITKALNTTSGGKLTEAINDLISCDFIRKYNSFGNKTNGAVFQLTDLYTLFYLHYIKGTEEADEHLWSNMIDSPAHRAWSGYAFEQLCLHHISQIKKKLGISGVQTNVYSWQQKRNEEKGTGGAQIDLVLDRRDQIINLCEMKYSLNEYDITPAYLQKLIERREIFRQASSTNKALHLTFVTAAGVKKNAQEGMIQSEVELNDLFVEK